MMNKKNILITGGAGFVGSHLCERLIANNNVVSLDNYFTGKKENHIKDVEYIYGDTRDIDLCIKLYSSIKRFDIVYHLGEYSRVEQSFDDIDLVKSYNIDGTYAVLKYCVKNNIKLVYSGSSTKFADDTEDYVQSPYAWSKVQNTELVKKFSEWYGLKYAITYFYNVYGQREISEGKYATLIGSFSEKIKNNEPLTVVLPGTQLRNFTHIDDIVDALVLIGEYGEGDEYGIGSDTAYSINEIANMFSSNIEYLEPRRGNRMSASVITEKTKKLGWFPKRNLIDYVDKLKNRL
jgi:UDP-glucose 4-epimerase